MILLNKNIHSFKPYGVQLGIVITSVLALWACGGKVAVQEFSDSADPVLELSTLNQDISAAKSRQADVLAPENFSEAQQFAEKAKLNLERGRNSNDTLHLIATGRAYLKSANEYSTLTQHTMEDVVVARQQALDAKTPNYFPGDLAKVDEALTDVTRDIEEHKMKGASKHRARLQEAYLDLELRSIKFANTEPALRKINEATKNGAEKYAPDTLATAWKTYKDTDAFITGNRHDTFQISVRARKLNESADHVLKITQDSKGNTKSSSESTALRMEGKQNQVDAKNRELVAKQGVVQALEGQNAAIETRLLSNEKFDEARREFSKSEAEVYRQGDTLTIRLRGLEFPESTAVLSEVNFPLLAKVQKVIGKFENSTIVVEGHTDSKGGKAKNLILSEKRAQAVREYLVSNDTVAPDRIQAIGYDFQKPIATNKTAIGRAQNRRVDILIQSARY